MKVVIVRRDNEPNDRAINRFIKKVNASRKVQKVRSDRYHSKKLTKGKVRAAAISREKYRAVRNKQRFH